MEEFWPVVWLLEYKTKTGWDHGSVGYNTKEAAEYMQSIDRDLKVSQIATRIVRRENMYIRSGLVFGLPKP